MHPTPGAAQPQASPTYGFHGVLPKQDGAQALARPTEALKSEGLGNLTEVDVQITKQAAPGIDDLPYRHDGACESPRGHGALTAESDIGLLRPCNVAVRQTANGKRQTVDGKRRAAPSAKTLDTPTMGRLMLLLR